MWIPPEVKDPVLLHHPTRKSVGYFGAVRLCDGKFLAIQEPKNLMPRRPGRSIVSSDGLPAVRGGALWSSWIMPDSTMLACTESGVRLKSPISSCSFSHITSPTLTPIERIWKLVRRLCLHNRYFPKLELVTETVECQFAQWRIARQHSPNSAQSFMTPSIEGSYDYNFINRPIEIMNPSLLHILNLLPHPFEFRLEPDDNSRNPHFIGLGSNGIYLPEHLLSQKIKRTANRFR